MWTPAAKIRAPRGEKSKDKVLADVFSDEAATLECSTKTPKSNEANTIVQGFGL